MPWILNAAFKVIKALLPAKAVAKMKFVNKSTLKDIVSAEHALVCWGGRDPYEYSFVSEVRQDNIYNSQTKIQQVGDVPACKKVHFAEGSPTGDSVESMDDKNNGEEMLHVTPLETITFQKDGNEMIGTITVTNKDPGSITYKVKTTSPEKFRVRPSTGPLTPGASVTISVTLQPGYHSTGLAKDKFLVMGIALPTEGQGEMSAQQLAEIWKNPGDHNVEQHKLKCVLPCLPENTKNGGILTTEPDSKQNINNILAKLTQLVESNKKLQAQVNFIQTLQWVMMVLLLLFAIIFVYIIKDRPENSNEKYCMSNINL
uniref:Putative vesicle-associated membrane protein-associated protein b/c n=1 Tax=Xenopsylla cheopis TaxID=163159 RepID=A0A6M2DWX2_XENCH